MIGIRVLLVDDDADALRLASEMLIAEGYSVYACSDCAHAARMASLMRPRIILINGCDADEAAMMRQLIGIAPHTPLICFRKEQSSYEVYAAGRDRKPNRIGYGYRTISTAIHAALMQKLNSV